MATCSRCDGFGIVECPSCNGQEHNYFVPLLGIWESDCSDCYGLGNITCPECEGDGEIFDAQQRA